MDNRQEIRVLIAEGDYLVGEMVKSMLEDMAYQVVGEAINGLEAVKLTQSLQPDVVLKGILAAKNILRHSEGQPQEAFHYQDRGTMATIGRKRAVAWIYKRILLHGFIAWIAWLGLHLITLMGFRNQLNVLVNWIWNYLTFDRSVRIILEHKQQRVAQETESKRQGEGL